MSYLITMTIFMAIISIIVIFMIMPDYTGDREIVREGRPAHSGFMDSYYQDRYDRAVKNAAFSRKILRFAFAGLLFSWLGGILLPLAAIAALGYGLWRLVYIVFFERVEVED